MNLLFMLTLLTLSAPMVTASSPTSERLTSTLYDIVNINSPLLPVCVTQTYTVHSGAQCPLFCERGPFCQDVITCDTSSSMVTCHTLGEDRTCSGTYFDATKCRRFSKRARNQQPSSLTTYLNSTGDFDVTPSPGSTSGADTPPIPTCTEIPDSAYVFTDCSHDVLLRADCMVTVTVQPQSYDEAFSVRCYRGQTLIQRRSSVMCDSAFFNRSWSEYASGFGEPDSCFWLGNNRIRALTNQADYSLHVDTRSSLGEWQTTLYMFKIDAAENQYKIHFMYEGNYGVSNGDRLFGMEGSSFYTYESNGTNSACAIVGGGWWYGDNCDCGNLNHLRGPRWLNGQGVLTFYNESMMTITPSSISRGAPDM